MSAPRVYTFAGRRDLAGATDLTSARDLIDALSSSDGVAIWDPMSFPWDSMPQGPLDCPVVVDISMCTSKDLTALMEPFGSLTASDAMLGDQGVVEQLCAELGLANLWFESDLDVAAFIERSMWAKRADVEERMITDRLSADSDITLVVVTRDMLGEAHADFASLTRRLSESLDGAVVDTIWGIHPYPGQPLDRAVVAFRPAAGT